MVRIRFNLRQMLLAATIMSIAIAALVSVARHIPEVFAFSFIFSCFIGLFGLFIVFLAAVMLFSVCASDNSDNRKLNIAKCVNLALIGALMIAIPFVISIAAVVLLPLVRPY